MVCAYGEQLLEAGSNLTSQLKSSLKICRCERIAEFLLNELLKMGIQYFRTVPSWISHALFEAAQQQQMRLIAR